MEERPACEKILHEFGLDPAQSHIVNGHVPVKPRKGESPIKGGGLLFMIDGGISKACLLYTSRPTPCFRP